jgi:hypothetical protein
MAELAAGWVVGLAVAGTGAGSETGRVVVARMVVGCVGVTGAGAGLGTEWMAGWVVVFGLAVEWVVDGEVGVASAGWVVVAGLEMFVLVVRGGANTIAGLLWRLGIARCQAGKVVPW